MEPKVDRVAELRAGRCTMHLNLPAVFDLSTLANIEKILKLLCTNDFEPCNRETIEILDAYIPQMVDEKKRLWHDASVVFCNEFRDSADPKLRTAEGYTLRRVSAAIRAKNARLIKTVASTKREYEKACCVAEIYRDSKEKYIYGGKNK